MLEPGSDGAAVGERLVLGHDDVSFLRDLVVEI
jgi:hypothetical protein